MSLFAKVLCAVVIVVVSAAIVCALLIGRVEPPITLPSHAPESLAAIDSANTISDPKWFNKAYNEGFRLYILHSTAWDTCDAWDRAQTQAQMALDAGLAVAAYTRDPRCYEQGIQAFGLLKDKLQFFALDIETDPGIPVTRTMIDGIKSLGVRPVIYTGAGMWPTIMNNSEAYSDVPLWDTDTSTFALENWEINYLTPTPIKYGGWNSETTLRIGIQQQFEYTLNGINVDLNSFSTSFIKTT